MEKEFNITGTCIPDMHYMVDTTKKLNDVIQLINKGKYFIINRPRQYGKTTTLFMLEKKLKEMEGYFPIKISFEAIDTESYLEAKTFIHSIMIQIVKFLRFANNNELYTYAKDQNKKITTMNEFADFITDFVELANKKIVLMIDEVDKSSNNQLFLDFLAMLRNKYLLRNEGSDYTFHSVILAGVHDIKSLKLKLRPDEEHKYNSPWNIASDFNVDMSFSVEEIKTMLDDYTANKPVQLDKHYFSEKLYFYTSGYPFLVSKLCKIIDEKIMPKDNLVWKKEYMDLAVKEILKDSNTNFDSLIKNIENNVDLKKLVINLIIEGNIITFNVHNRVINLGILYGIFKNENGFIKLNNKIYEHIIYNYLSSLIEISTDIGYYTQKSDYLQENGDLDIPKILIKFQEFMKHEYNNRSRDFIEKDGRLIFLAFISPILNGSGFAFKEVQGGEEKRFDIVITYNKKMYIIELKIWRGESQNQKGLIQLGEYLEQYGLNEGYLLAFDVNKKMSESGKAVDTVVQINGNDKKILGVYC